MTYCYWQLLCRLTTLGLLKCCLVICPTTLNNHRPLGTSVEKTTEQMFYQMELSIYHRWSTDLFCRPVPIKLCRLSLWCNWCSTLVCRDSTRVFKSRAARENPLFCFCFFFNPILFLNLIKKMRGHGPKEKFCKISEHVITLNAARLMCEHNSSRGGIKIWQCCLGAEPRRSVNLPLKMKNVSQNVRYWKNAT